MTVDRVQGDKLLGMARAFAGPPKRNISRDPNTWPRRPLRRKSTGRTS